MLLHLGKASHIKIYTKKNRKIDVQNAYTFLALHCLTTQMDIGHTQF